MPGRVVTKSLRKPDETSADRSIAIALARGGIFATILGTLGASVGQVWGLAGGGRGEKMVMLWKIKKKRKKHRKNARSLAKYWTVLCAGASEIWRCAAAGGQSGLHGSIQGLNLAHRSNIGKKGDRHGSRWPSLGPT